MNDLKEWVAVENDVVVHGPFQAPQEYIDFYTDEVVDREDRETPYWYNENVEFVDVTDIDPSPAAGWTRYLTRDNKNEFVAPVPTQEETDAQAAEEAARVQRESDIARVKELRAKVGPGKPPLSQDEQNELNLIVASLQLNAF